MRKLPTAPGVQFAGACELDGHPMELTAWPDGRVLVSFGVVSLRLSAEAAAKLAGDLLTLATASQNQGGEQ